ncbi:Protein of unknown function [Pyronema omphalodes CBS 100304]|uniref:Uncharacterized protein n=1 Tax=Pyronema omphalodes (strain CBS 100304) TaxID=1076935 RepID=U4LAY6_PYROM|nr:Protein of unknown function [Pyronema omphalodes CBS 100304]
MGKIKNPIPRGNDLCYPMLTKLPYPSCERSTQPSAFRSLGYCALDMTGWKTPHHTPAKTSNATT